MKKYAALIGFFTFFVLALTSCEHKTADIFQTNLPDIGHGDRARIDQQITDWFVDTQEEMRREGGQPERQRTETDDDGDVADGTPQAPEGETGGGEVEGGEGGDSGDVDIVGEGEDETSDGGEIPGEVPTDETPDIVTGPLSKPKIFVKPPRPGIMAEASPPPPLEVAPCEPSRGFIQRPEGCVCDGTRGFHTPPEGYDPRDSQGRRRCLRKISKAILTLHVGSFQAARSDDATNIIFQICNRPPSLILNSNPSDRNCFSVRLTPRNTLWENSKEVIEYTRDGIVSGGLSITGAAYSHSRYSEKELGQLYYPDDVQYLMIRPYGDVEDALFFSALKFEIETGEGSLRTLLYDNHCVNRWIKKPDTNASYVSPHSIHFDDAWCFYIETASQDQANTSCDVSVRIPLDDAGLLEPSAEWIQSEGAISSPNITLPYFSPLSSHMEYLLDHDDYTDFARGARTTYGFTVYDGHSRMEDKYQLRIDCGDAWKPHIAKAAHILPGAAVFLNSGYCAMDVTPIDRWLSTQTSDDSGRAKPTWPNPAQEYHSLRGGDCSTISEFKLEEEIFQLPLLE